MLVSMETAVSAMLSMAHEQHRRMSQQLWLMAIDVDTGCCPAGTALWHRGTCVCAPDNPRFARVRL